MTTFNGKDITNLDIGIRKFLKNEFLIYYSESLRNEDQVMDLIKNEEHNN
jgi:hypothetical protein